MFYRILHLVPRRLCNIATQKLYSLTKRYYIFQNKWNREQTSAKRCLREDVYMFRLHQNNENSDKKCNCICFLQVYKYDIVSLKGASSTQITLKTGRYWVPIVWRMTHCLHWKPIAAIPIKQFCSTSSKITIHFSFGNKTNTFIHTSKSPLVPSY